MRGVPAWTRQVCSETRAGRGQLDHSKCGQHVHLQPQLLSSQGDDGMPSQPGLPGPPGPKVSIHPLPLPSTLQSYRLPRDAPNPGPFTSWGCGPIPRTGQREKAVGSRHPGSNLASHPGHQSPLTLSPLGSHLSPSIPCLVPSWE